MRAAKPLAALALGAVVLTGCSSDSEVASSNLSRAAEQGEIMRRITFLNGITGEELLRIEGRCSVDVITEYEQLAVTCLVEEGRWIKHYLGLSDNVTYVSEQIGSAEVDVYRYRRIFKPESIVPDIDLETSVTSADDGND